MSLSPTSLGGRLGEEFQRLIDQVNRQEARRSETVIPNAGPTGTTFEARVKIDQWMRPFEAVVDTVGDDYLKCVPFGDSNFGFVYALKPSHLRKTEVDTWTSGRGTNPHQYVSSSDWTSALRPVVTIHHRATAGETVRVEELVVWPPYGEYYDAIPMVHGLPTDRVLLSPLNTANGVTRINSTTLVAASADVPVLFADMNTQARGWRKATEVDYLEEVWNDGAYTYGIGSRIGSIRHDL
tara:strand:- start:2454 stop:3170 length:717 start_codon:yes stop_codon:yes gene_type:complete